MSIIENSHMVYACEVIAKRDNVDSLLSVGRPTKKAEGPLTFATLVGQFIREQRQERSLTQPDLAAASGVPQSQLSAFENGKKNISAKNIEAVLGALGVNVREMILELAKMVLRPDQPAARQPTSEASSSLYEEVGTLKLKKKSAKPSETLPTTRPSR